MKWISYRGNRHGSEHDKENTPDWIYLSINEGFEVMIDVWYGEDIVWRTGKDDNKIEMDVCWLDNDKIWFYPRNDTTLEKLKSLEHPRIFNHIDNRWCWCPETTDTKIGEETETSQYNFLCSSYIAWYKQRAEAKKRIAILIGGRLTCQDICLLPQIRNYLHKHQDHWIDVFISINNEPENYENYKKLYQMDAPFIRVISCEKTICPEKYSHYQPRAGETNVPTCISMYYHNYLAMRLITEYKERNRTHYHIILKYRPDIVEQNNELPIVASPFKEFLQDVDGNNFKQRCVYMPNTVDTTYNGIPKTNDQIGIGSYDVMMQYMGIYPTMIDYLEQRRAGYLLHPETILGFHLQEMGIETVRFTYSYSLHHKRY